MQITVPVTITLSGALAPGADGLIPGSGHWFDGPHRADEFALAHLAVALLLPADWMHAHAHVKVERPSAGHVQRCAR